MKKILYPFACLFLVFCSKDKSQQNSNFQDSIINKIDSNKTITEIQENTEPKKQKIVINTFSKLPEKYSNDSDANAYFFTDSQQAEKNGIKYGVCDFINNVAILKINGNFEKLNDISGADSYLENKIFENANFRLELDLNEKISDKLTNKIISNIPLEGAYVLKGTLKLIDLKNNTDITKNTFVLGF